MSIVVIVLILLMIFHSLIGFLLKRKSGDVYGFVLAGQKVKPLAAAFSLVATIIGASAILGTSGLAGKNGPSAFVWLGSGIVGLALLIFLLEKIDFRQAFSLPGMLGKHGGAGVRLASALVILPTWIGIVAAQFAAVGKISEALEPGSYTLMVIAAAVCTGIYVALSGQGGVIKTDKFQFVFISLLLFTLALTMFVKAGDFSAVKFQPLSTTKMIDISIAVAFPFLIGPDIFSRLLTLENNQQRKKTLVLAIAALLIMALVITFIGSYSALFVKTEASEQIMVKLPQFFWGEAGAVLAGVALLAAIISSADTCLFTSATIIAVDVVGIKSRKTIAILALVIAVLSAILALWLGGVLKALFISYTIYTSGLAVPAILALIFKRKLSGFTLVTTVLTGSSIGVYGRFNEMSFSLPIAIAASLIMALAGIFLENRKKAFRNS